MSQNIVARTRLEQDNRGRTAMTVQSEKDICDMTTGT